MIKCNKNAEEAFQRLKVALCQHSVLVVPDFDKEFVVQTNASNEGLGAVLSQWVSGEEHPVVFLYGVTLTVAEKNYAVVEQECLANQVGSGLSAIFSPR